MKKILTILITFIIAFATTLLFDLQFIEVNKVRVFLVFLIIVIELLVGYNVLKVITIKSKKDV
jgi:hypothetical protein